jgi:hypothetical protein
MLEKYRDAAASVRGPLRGYILDYFCLSRRSRRSLFDLCREAGLGQADLVISLVRAHSAEADAAIERLIGRPILRLPPQRRDYRRPKIVSRTGDDRLVTAFSIGATTLRGGAILPGSPMYDRLAVIRPGMSLLGLVARGVSRRDIRIAVRRGWLEIEEAA